MDAFASRALESSRVPFRSSPSPPLRRPGCPPPGTGSRVPRGGWLLLAILTACGGEAPPSPGGDVDPAFEAARDHAFRLFDAARTGPETLAALRRAHDLDPAAYGVNIRLGRAYAELKLHAQALPFLEAALAARPDETATLSHVITLLTRVERFDDALSRVDGLLTDPGWFGVGLYQKACLLDLLGRREEARLATAQALDLDPELGHRAQALHARFLQEDGHFAEALVLFERALPGRPDLKETLRGLADCRRRLGDDEGAAHWDEVLGLMLELTDNTFAREQPESRKQTLARLAVIHPMWQEGQLELCDLLARDGDLPQACAAYEDFLAAHPRAHPEQEIAARRARYCGSAP